MLVMPSLGLTLVLSTLFLSSNLIFTYGAPFKATDTYQNPCSFIEPTTGDAVKGSLPAPKLWSDPSTWSDGIVPGINGAVGANATIPCGTSVLLDVSSIEVGLLRVQGLLRFQDSSALPTVTVKAHFVLVEGQLFIGSRNQPFSQKAVIELTPNLENNRAGLTYTFSLPADPQNPRKLGLKVFAIVGGQVVLNGMPSNDPNMPAWVKLSSNGNIGDRTLQVDADVSASWPVGSQIVVTSTDYDLTQAESFSIVSIASSGGGFSTITLDGTLSFNHYGLFNTLSDGFGGFIDERAEVMLLSRNIIIKGTVEDAPNNLIGGHFVTFMTNKPAQFIQGVEFVNMGQQGTLGRYPVHFHIIGSVPDTVCRKNSIHKSFQRCIVVHASHNITIEDNVAFDTSGHCFILEEGGELDNSFIHNLGAVTKAVQVKISAAETDNNPSTFWMSSLPNRFIGNVAAGSEDSGFWFELRYSVRGDSLLIPSMANVIPIFGKLGLFLNNTVHSNKAFGFRTYPRGLQPRVKVSPTYYAAGPANVLDGLVSYKNAEKGAFVHLTDNLIMKNAVFADNGWGIYFKQNNAITVADSRFISLSANYGTPSQCFVKNNLKVNCRAADISVCRYPPYLHGIPVRSTGGKTRSDYSFGIIADVGRLVDFAPYRFKNISFSNYNPACDKFAALTMNGGYDLADYWNAANSVEGLKFTKDSLPVWVPPRLATSQLHGLQDGVEQAYFFVLEDKDGSLTGGQPGYIVPNNSFTAPPTSYKKCTPVPSWNGFACTSVCYRTLMVTYPEPGFGPSQKNYDNTKQQFSTLSVTRLSDGKNLVLLGNLNDVNPAYAQRAFFMNVLGNEKYRVKIIQPAKNPNFVPSKITVQLMDLSDCGQGLTVQIQQSQSYSWTVPATNNVIRSLCPGATTTPPGKPLAMFKTVCVNKEPWVELNLGANTSQIPVNLFKAAGISPFACPAKSSCGVVLSGESWFYNDSGLELRPDFYDPKSVQYLSWSAGLTPIGYNPRSSYPVSHTRRPVPKSLVTYYFRNSFNVTNAACFDSVSFDLLVNDGVIVYINGVEVLRANMPAGPVTTLTNALSRSAWVNWQAFTVPFSSVSGLTFIEGQNSVAVEQHVGKGSFLLAFDLRMTAQANASCASL